MKFKMNNHDWEILELSKEQIIAVYEKEMETETLYVYGLTKYDNHKIYINEELCFDMKRKTLMHELMHCYIEEYVSLELEDYKEETMCNISANSHDIIHKIVDDYFMNIMLEERNVGGEKWKEINNKKLKPMVL
jgi:hypothetical protein